MGFKRWWHDLHAICVGFKVVPLKTHANTSRSSEESLKPIHNGVITRGLASIPCIYTGFKRGWHELHAIRAGFKVVPLKTHANTSRSSK